MIDYKLIGCRLKSERLKKKYTQETAAELCNITVEYLSKIENGKAKATLDTLSTICDAYGCDIGCILSNTSITQKGYQSSEISNLFDNLKPEVKTIALDLLEKMKEL